MTGILNKEYETSLCPGYINVAQPQFDFNKDVLQRLDFCFWMNKLDWRRFCRSSSKGCFREFPFTVDCIIWLWKTRLRRRRLDGYISVFFVWKKYWVMNHCQRKGVFLLFQRLRLFRVCLRQIHEAQHEILPGTFIESLLEKFIPSCSLQFFLWYIERRLYDRVVSCRCIMS